MKETLLKNIDTEIRMLQEISELDSKLVSLEEKEKVFVTQAISSLKTSIKLVNNSIPTILQALPSHTKLPVQKVRQPLSPRLESVAFEREGPSYDVVLNRSDKNRFLKELRISEELIKKLRKKKQSDEEQYREFQRSRGYLRIANKYFLESAKNLVNKGRFKDLSVDLRKANFDILFESYIALMIFTTVLSVFVGFFLFAFFLFFNVSFSLPIIAMHNGDYLSRLMRIFWLPIVLPLITFIGFYVYPSTEKSSIESKINQELPFAVIHMSAISGSGIAPSEIFKIIGLSKEYPYLRKEIRKILNQINLYGYDLVTALNNVSKRAPSEKLAELFSGLSTTITSGADLSEFFEKRAETLMLNYRLERERYTKVIETFLDIYISIVIAAPMIFLLLLVMMLISGIEIGLTSLEITFISVAGVALLNVFFLVFLQLRQPTY